LTHALSDKSNKTKFTLLFSNLTEKDILLREKVDALKKQHPDTFDVVYLIDKPEKGWNGVFFVRSLRGSGQLSSSFRSNRLHLRRRDQATRSPSLFERESEDICLRYVPFLSFPLKRISHTMTRTSWAGGLCCREESRDEAG
jgi:ferredoxin-NADP reductase